MTLLREDSAEVAVNSIVSLPSTMASSNMFMKIDFTPVSPALKVMVLLVLYAHSLLLSVPADFVNVMVVAETCGTVKFEVSSTWLNLGQVLVETPSEILVCKA